MFNYIIIGSGFAGSVIAERIATQLNKKVLIIERRNHIGGNCYDYKNVCGIVVHKYGPHLFHTDSKEVFDYLSNFTEWQIYQHRVLAFVDGIKVPIPFNFNSMDMLFPTELSQRIQRKLIEKYGYGIKIPILDLKKSKDRDIQFLANFVYERIFLHYTAKQWGKRPEEINHEVTARVPVFIGRDDRYFDDKYQAVPKDGYTKIFEKMLNHANIKLMLNTNFNEIISIDHDAKKIYFMGSEFTGKLIFTGQIDELFDYKYGMLDYRNLRFEFKTFDQDFYQEVAQVNYPNNYDFTRITEFKHIHPAEISKTTVAFEYPEDFTIGKTPYYPMFTKQAEEKYNRYLELSKKFNNLILVGRLAEYKYYDMDDIVKRALDVFEEKIK